MTRVSFSLSRDLRRAPLSFSSADVAEDKLKILMTGRNALNLTWSSSSVVFLPDFFFHQNSFQMTNRVEQNHSKEKQEKKTNPANMKGNLLIPLGFSFPSLVISSLIIIIIIAVIIVIIFIIVGFIGFAWWKSSTCS